MFLQAVVVLIGVVVLTILIVLPTREGRAENLDLFHIYADPLILYCYTASISFFVALYKAFKLLAYIRRNQVFSRGAVKAIKGIKYCAMLLGISILPTGVYIRVFHPEEDDPAGFISLCIMATFACIVVATAAAIFEKILQNAVDMKSENDLTI